MAGLNKVMIIGNLGQDPELRLTATGTQVANISVATSEKWTNKAGEPQEKVEWHRIVLFDKLAELSGKFLSKGKQVYIEGKLQTRAWDDKDGVKRYTTEIVATSMTFLDKKDEPQQEPKTQQKTKKQQPKADDSFPDDNVPF